MFRAGLSATPPMAVAVPHHGRVHVKRPARTALAGSVCTALLVAGWTLRSDSGQADDDAGFDAETARYFNLPDGEAQIGVSRVDGRYVTVRWRDADGETWSDPETVYDAGDDAMYDFMRIRVAGPTLALFATFVPLPDPSEDFEGYPAGVGTTVFIVCRDGGCATSEEYDGRVDRAPQITPDGEYVYFAERDDVLVTWNGGRIEERTAALPPGDYGTEQTLLAPDGSLRAVRGEAGPGGCDFTLLTTEPGGSDFHAGRHAPGRRRHQRRVLDDGRELRVRLRRGGGQQQVPPVVRDPVRRRLGDGVRGPQRSGPLPADGRLEDRGTVRHQWLLALEPRPCQLSRRHETRGPGASAGRRTVGAAAAGRPGTRGLGVPRDREQADVHMGRGGPVLRQPQVPAPPSERW